MLQQRAGLGAADLDAITALERRVVAADGGRLKLEWASLRSRSGDRVEDLLWREGEELLGFAGLYGFGGAIEIAGMVDPSARRRGIGTALLDAALTLARGRDATTALLVCPRTQSGPAAAFAASCGGVLEHSEHALVLLGDPGDGPTDDHVTLRAATAPDIADVDGLIFAGFGHHIDLDPTALATERGQGLMIERDGRTVGYVRLTLDAGVGGVFGFVIDDSLRGRGIGRDVLRRCCRRLIADGATRVGLEVATDNEHALGLYTSLGFEPIITEDYFQLETAAASAT